MSGKSNAAPIIIKRKKVVGGGGHHGGAWKVAYADFVTAMMAFFLLMWLLGATTEKQRKGVADYFSPTVSMTPSSGGEGMLAGDSSVKEDSMAYSGSGVEGGRNASTGGEMTAAQLKEMKAEIDHKLTAYGGESMTMQRALRHIVTKITDEGLVIEIFDLEDAPLFTAETAEPQPITRDIAGIVTNVLAIATNGVAVNGHVRSYPVTLINNPVWDLSAARAETIRGLLEASGMASQRIRRITGHADRVPVTADPMVIRNNRIEIVLLRKDR
ncbi:flagellar motor protein MotB [Gemmobacter denitrificans]|uniref:Flagellar motor protein MotB n=1 Tax=Gemmobacter denitrificans TaxID=3123040 RepID=A0ABU8BZX6_9RHOB